MSETELAKEFEKVLFEVINKYINDGLKKPDLIRKLEWVLGSCKLS